MLATRLIALRTHLLPQFTPTGTYTDEELVSVDFNHNPASSTFDLTQTQVIEGRFCRVLSWYDNEWGFSNRMLDTAAAMAKLL